SKTLTQFLGLVRGAGGTTAASHSPGAVISSPVLSAHHNAVVAAVVAAETKLGSGSGTPASNTLLEGTSSGVSAWRTLSQVKTDLALNNVDNVQQLPLAYLDTDAALAASSDSKVASQNAIKRYVDAGEGVSLQCSGVNDNA